MLVDCFMGESFILWAFFSCPAVLRWWTKDGRLEFPWGNPGGSPYSLDNSWKNLAYHSFHIPYVGFGCSS